MTDNEIIKALECCSNYGLLKCRECPKKSDGKTCMYELSKDALDLINRLKANEEKNENIIRFADKTIEKQSAEIDRLEDMLDGSVSSERNTVDNIQHEKAEAIKEFANNVKKHFFQVELVGYIDSFVEEVEMGLR